MLSSFWVFSLTQLFSTSASSVSGISSGSACVCFDSANTTNKQHQEPDGYPGALLATLSRTLEQSTRFGDLGYLSRLVLSRQHHRNIKHPVFPFKAGIAAVTLRGHPITDFDGHTIAVRLPYALAKDEKAGNLYAVYVDGKGKVEWLTKSSYDPDLGTVVFETGHFSIYGIGYKNPVPVFTDIKNHWAEDNIIFVASRGLLTSTGNNQFSPDTGMTRGMFVTALGRLAGIDPDSYKTGKFTDVKADAYYAPYVNWAAEKGIVNGTTATTFSPDTNITREQMAVNTTIDGYTIGPDGTRK